MTGEEHNKYLAYSFLAHGAFQVFWMLAMSLFFLFFMTSIPQQSRGDDPPAGVFIFFIGFIVLIQMIFAAPSFIAGYALWKRKRWARIAGIIGAVMAGASFPIGTAVCVYAFWFLLSDRGKSMYEDQNITSQNYFPPHGWQGYSPPNLWAERPGDEAEVNDWRKQERGE